MVEYFSGRAGAALLPYHPDRGQEGEKGEVEEGGGEKEPPPPSSFFPFSYLAEISSPGNNAEYFSGRAGAALLPYHPARGQEGEKGEVEERGGENIPLPPSLSVSFSYLAEISSPGNNG